MSVPDIKNLFFFLIYMYMFFALASNFIYEIFKSSSIYCDISDASLSCSCDVNKKCGCCTVYVN